jgi:L-lactate dehydrogenase complex protein LldG
MSARTEMLERVRGRLKRTRRDTEAARRDIRSYLALRQHGPRSSAPADALELFCRCSESMSSTVHRVGSIDDAPAAVCAYLRERGLPRQAVCWPRLAGLPWAAAGVRVETRAACEHDAVGITGAFCAIAETGTLVLCSGADTPSTVSLLPETHIAVLDAARIVLGMEEAWQLARSELDALPRAVTLVSGPSRTGDIEQTIVLGAHGPYRVHIILVHPPL